MGAAESRDNPLAEHGLYALPPPTRRKADDADADVVHSPQSIHGSRRERKRTKREREREGERERELEDTSRR